MIIKQSSTARELVFLMIDSADHVTGKTGLSPTVTISKNGGSFASPSGAVTEIANGLYKVAGNATDTNTLGSLVLHATGTGADPCDMMYEVVAVNVDDTVRMGLTALPNAAAEAAGGLYTRGTGAGQINQPANGMVDSNVVRNAGTAITSAAGIQEVKVASIAANAITATAINADAITDAKVASDVTIASVTGAVGSVTGAVGSVAAGGITAASFAANAITAAKLDPDVTTELQAGLATAAALATVDGIVDDILADTADMQPKLGTPVTNLSSDIAAIEAQTDDIGAAGAGLTALASAANLATVAGYLDTEVSAIKAKTDQLVFTVANQVDANALSGGGGLDAAGVRSAIGLGSANLDTQLTDLPTNAELATALGTADDAVLAQVALVKAKTDNLPATPAATGDVMALSAAETKIMHSGTAQGGGAGTITLAAGASAASGSYLGSIIKIYGGTGAGQSRVITGYNGTNKLTLVGRSWAVQPDNTSLYSIFADDTAPVNEDLKVIGVVLADTITTYTGDTPQTGDSFARIGAAGTGLTSRASQTSVDDLPTNAELATALGTADDAVLTAIAALNNLSQANIRSAVGLGSANLDTQLGDLPTNSELATALGTADDAILAAIAALNNLSIANIRTAVGLASANLDTQLADLPTNAELTAALGTADDAVLTQLTTLSGYIDTEVAAIKAKTDNLPVDPADASDIAASFTSIASTLTTLATYIDTEVAAIKAKTDGLPTTPAATGDAMTLTAGERTSIGTAVWASATRTLSSFGTLVADIWAAATRTLTAAVDSSGITTLLSRIGSALTITGGKVDVNDKTGFELTAAYDPAKTAATQASVNDLPTNAELDTALSLISFPTASSVADAVWDEAIADHADAGSTGEQLAAAAASGDPWTTALPGAYADGTAGQILGDLNPESVPGAFLETITVTDEGLPIAEALVAVSNGQHTWKMLTNEDGVASFHLDAGVYVVSITKPGYQFKSSSITVTG